MAEVIKSTCVGTKHKKNRPAMACPFVILSPSAQVIMTTANAPNTIVVTSRSSATNPHAPIHDGLSDSAIRCLPIMREMIIGPTAHACSAGQKRNRQAAKPQAGVPTRARHPAHPHWRKTSEPETSRPRSLLRRCISHQTRRRSRHGVQAQVLSRAPERATPSPQSSVAEQIVDACLGPRLRIDALHDHSAVEVNVVF